MGKNQSARVDISLSTVRTELHQHSYALQRILIMVSLVFISLFLTPSKVNAQESRPSVTINGGARSTDTERVDLTFVLPRRTDRMRIANSRRELAEASWRQAKEHVNGWYLPKRSGHQYVYVDFEIRDGGIQGSYSDSIVVNITDFDGERLVISGGDVVTESRRVVLNIGIPPNALRMRISNSFDIAGAGWFAPRNELFWTLSGGTGKRTVYLQFQYRDGRLSNIFQDDIRLIEPIEAQVGLSINRGFAKTYSRNVVASLSYSHGIKEIRLSNDDQFRNSEWRSPEHLVPWKLSAGAGEKAVFAQFKDFNDKVQTVSASITYEEPVTRISEPHAVPSLPIHSIVKGPGPGVYYMGEDQKLHPFESSGVFYSWYTNVANLRFVSGAEIARYEIGSPVCVRGGTWLVRFGTLPEIYAVEQGCRLRPLRSEVEAFLIYGTDWAKRIITLSATGQSAYNIVNYSAADSFSNKIDADGDGLEEEIESALGTSDRQKDTDGDKVSDYEEFYWWFTDPTKRDTDGDGMGDGDEILNLRQPLGEGSIHAVAENTYFYPKGSVFRHSNNRYYFHAVPEGPLYMGWRTSDKRFTSHRFQERFIIYSPVTPPFNTRVRSLATDVVPIAFPTIHRDGAVVPL